YIGVFVPVELPLHPVRVVAGLVPVSPQQMQHGAEEWIRDLGVPRTVGQQGRQRIRHANRRGSPTGTSQRIGFEQAREGAPTGLALEQSYIRIGIWAVAISTAGEDYQIISPTDVRARSGRRMS